MSNEQVCDYCREQFKDGAVVSINQFKKVRHSFLHGRYEPPMNRECTMLDVMHNRKPEISDLGVFYKGALYDFSCINRLPSVNELTIEEVTPLKGERIIGNLDDLVKHRPFWRFEEPQTARQPAQASS